MTMTCALSVNLW